MQQILRKIDELLISTNCNGLITQFDNWFYKSYQKKLLRVEGQINQMKVQLNTMGYDFTFLISKKAENVKSIYVPSKAQEKGEYKLCNLMTFKLFDDKVGEVNEFYKKRKQYCSFMKQVDQAKVLQLLKLKGLFAQQQLVNYVLNPFFKQQNFVKYFERVLNYLILIYMDKIQQKKYLIKIKNEIEKNLKDVTLLAIQKNNKNFKRSKRRRSTQLNFENNHLNQFIHQNFYISTLSV
ncbi:unnamed protein product [Paramecium primaurelia]|uniref:Uncharacterized protein n=1 Tax=Paramecium primaurelia TaxID=5886 RepID=A0A8S1LUM2_PARPR|nr:unnamed protein product [Paramecium primaurelia]